MPLKWSRDRKSPYACNHFAVLRVGPNMRRPEIQSKSRELLLELQDDREAHCACGHVVDAHEVGFATNQLLEAGPLAEELLLVHPQPPRDNQTRINALAANLRKAATLPMPRNPMALRHPADILCLMPAPGEDVIGCPSWEDLGLGQAGDAQDLALDIVFDR